VTAQDADSGDTTTRVEILAQAGENAAELIRTEKPTQKPQAHLKGIEEMVADKGYHSGAVVVNLQSAEVRTYIRRRKQTGQRHLEGKAEDQQAVYANRRRVQGAYAQRPHRRRGELPERNFAHCCDMGGMRRTHLRGYKNISQATVDPCWGVQSMLDLAHSTGGPKRLESWKIAGPCLLLCSYSGSETFQHLACHRKSSCSSFKFSSHRNRRHLR
jgi:hypothetical protein